MYKNKWFSRLGESSGVYGVYKENNVAIKANLQFFGKLKVDRNQTETLKIPKIRKKKTKSEKEHEQFE